MKKRCAAWVILTILLMQCISPPVLAVDVMPQKSDEHTVFVVSVFVLRGVDSTRCLGRAITFEEDPAVVEYVRRTKADEKIIEAVEREAANPEAWWEWLNSLPEDSNTTLDQQEVLEWFEDYITLPEEVKHSLGRNFMTIGSNN